MDKLQVINRALMKVGLPYAASVNDADWHAADVYDACVEDVLRSFAWGFAMELAALAQTAKPICGFARAYQLPDDFIRVVDARTCQDLRSPAMRQIQVRGKKLYCQESPCYLRYITRNVSEEDWPADFADAVACRIALEIAPLSAQTPGLVPQLVQLYTRSLAMAQANDARENAERVPLDHNILDARGGGHVGKKG